MMKKLLTLTEEWATLANIISFISGLATIFTVGFGLGLIANMAEDEKFKLEVKKSMLES